MNKQEYTTKSGCKQWRPVLSEKQVYKADDEGIGFCLACGATRRQCEPDAARYTCEKCGAPKVYGISQLAIMGLAIIK